MCFCALEFCNLFSKSCLFSHCAYFATLVPSKLQCIIDRLDIPGVLIELLIGHGLTVEQLLEMSSSDVAEALNIDVDTVRFIAKAVRKLLDNEVTIFDVD